MVHQERIELSTGGHGEMHDLSDEVREVVARSGIDQGLANVHVIGSTGAVGTIEYEPGLQRDLPAIFDKLMPPGRHYGHEQAWHDGNAHSHLQATTLGPSLSVPIGGGTPILGTWQQIFFLECDVKARRREIVITVMGE